MYRGYMQPSHTRDTFTEFVQSPNVLHNANQLRSDPYSRTPISQNINYVEFVRDRMYEWGRANNISKYKNAAPKDILIYLNARFVEFYKAYYSPAQSSVPVQQSILNDSEICNILPTYMNDRKRGTGGVGIHRGPRVPDSSMYGQIYKPDQWMNRNKGIHNPHIRGAHKRHYAPIQHCNSIDRCATRLYDSLRQSTRGMPAPNLNAYWNTSKP